jgi:hypothetical protein
MLELLDLLLEPFLLDVIVESPEVGMAATIIVLNLFTYWTSFVLTGSILPTLFFMLISLLVGWAMSPRPLITLALSDRAAPEGKS